jgi:hypothetical protein
MANNLCTCLESIEDVLSVIYDPNGNALTHGEIVARLNESPKLNDEIERLKAALEMIAQIIHGPTRWPRNIALAVLKGGDCRKLEDVEKM